MHIPPLTSRGIATPMHSPWLSFSFLVIRATLPTHFVEPCALGRWVWVCGKAAGSATPPPHPLCRTLCLRKVGVGVWQSCWFGHAPSPHPSPRNKTLLKLSIYYVCPKPDYNDTTTKKNYCFSLNQYETSSRTNRS